MQRETLETGSPIFRGVRMTKEQAMARVEYCRRMAKNSNRTHISLYRVGNQWMSTTSTEEVVQAKYKVKIKEFQTFDL